MIDRICCLNNVNTNIFSGPMQLILRPEQCHSCPVGKTLKHQSIKRTSIHYIPHTGPKSIKLTWCACLCFGVGLISFENRHHFKMTTSIILNMITSKIMITWGREETLGEGGPRQRCSPRWEQPGTHSENCPLQIFLFNFFSFIIRKFASYKHQSKHVLHIFPLAELVP